MASLLKKQGRYYAQFYDEHRRPKRKTVALKTTKLPTAKQALRRLEDELALGRFDPWQDQPERQEEDLRYLGPAVRAFMASKAHRTPDTLRTYRSIYHLFEQALGGDFPVASLRADHVVHFLDSTDAGDVTRRKYNHHLGYLFRWLVGKNLMRRDISKETPLRKVPQKHPKHLAPGEVDQLLAAVEPPYLWLRPLVQANVYLGLRAGEIVNLRWEDVDLERGVLLVRNTERFTTKSGKERTLPLCREALQVLAALERRSEYVFPSPMGKRLSKIKLSQLFCRFRRKAGLKEGISFHSTRHTAASWLVEQGASLEAVRRYLGHSSVTVTERYAHLSSDVYAAQITRALNGVKQ